LQKKGKKFKRSVADELSADGSRPGQGGAIGGQPQATNPNSSVAVTVKGRRFRRAAESKNKEVKKQEQQQEEQQQQKQQQQEQQQEEELVQEEECYEVPEVHCTYRRPRGGYYGGEDEVDGLFSRFDDSGRSRYAQPGGRFVNQNRDRNSYRYDDSDMYELSESLQLLKAGGERGRLRQAKVGDRSRNFDRYRYPESFETFQDYDGESVEENPSRYRDGRNEKSARHRWSNDRDVLRGYPERTVAVEDFNDVGEGSWLAELVGGLESQRTDGLYRTRTGSRVGAAADTAKLTRGRSAARVTVDPVLRRFSSGKLVPSGGSSNINSFGEENDDGDNMAFVEGRSAPRWIDGEREDASNVEREQRGRANPRFRRYAAEGPEERYCETKVKVVCSSKSQQQQPAGGRIRARRDLGEKIGKFFPVLGDP
jgi:hypothetical protein